ncbi:isochorismatase family protein [Mesorhizobium sp. BR1-1-4]|nr:isochorismatase family protein [Mesorhizobium sp. CO1-1-11]MBZ9683872.1 isochorismatase family protein [Mesorhizobium sp. CO1-1-2]MBZ9696608.1 isochorismatase family protein [Mesorhizobium sp. CO1-1-9]MBZ9725401.1 isochorismatase family protein [Mesorhizobium sp. CO1-1-11]MBZ9923664.1 isochorismatase family protein [Mesorhizobium sp. BR1-1-4]
MFNDYSTHDHRCATGDPRESGRWRSAGRYRPRTRSRCGPAWPLELAAEAAGVPVVVVQHDGDAGHRLEVGSPGWQLREEVSAIQDTILIRKRSCDAFHNTDLAYRIRELEVDRLVIGGCMTQF